MTYCLVLDVPGSVESYKAAHAEFSKYPTDAMLLHIARPTDGGVQVVEVWTSEEAFGEWMGACIGPVASALAAAGWTLPEVVPVPFEPAGFILPSARISY